MLYRIYNYCFNLTGKKYIWISVFYNTYWSKSRDSSVISYFEFRLLLIKNDYTLSPDCMQGDEAGKPSTF